jgi:type I restriction enzyme S subunit
MSRFPTVPLIQVARLLSGGTPSKAISSYWQGSIPWLTPKDMGQWAGATEETVSESAIGNGTRLAPPETVFIAVRGMSLHNEIRIIQTDEALTFNQDIKAIVAKEDANRRFLYFALLAKKDELLGSVEAAGHGTGRLPTDRLEALSIPKPSPAVQEDLANFFGVIEDKIKLNRTINKNLEKAAMAVFKDWFIDFGPTIAKSEGKPPYWNADIWAVFPGSIDSSGVPASWRIGELKELVEFNPKEQLSAGSMAPYLDMAALPTFGPIADLPIERTFTSGTRFRNGDALLARITPCLENGKTAFVQYLTSGAIGWGSTEFIVMRSIQPVPPPYAYLVAREPVFRALAIQSMTGTSGRQRARSEVLMRHPIVIAPPPVWKAFGSIVEPMFDQIATNGSESRMLAETRDMLLPRVISGDLRLRDAERRVGEVG